MNSTPASLCRRFLIERSTKLKYLAIDPGVTTGWASFDEKGQTLDFGEIKGIDEFLDFFEGIDHSELEHVICEDYIVDKRVSHGGSRVPTIQLIGAIKRYCHKNKIPLHMQHRAAKDIGIKFIGMKKPKGHMPDKISALCHGVYWLQRNGIRESRLKRK